MKRYRLVIAVLLVGISVAGFTGKLAKKLRQSPRFSALSECAEE